MNIYEKLSAIQQDLKAPKSNHNDFGNYNYRSAEDILEAVKPVCAKHKAVAFLSDTIKSIGDRNYVEAAAALIDLEVDDVLGSERLHRIVVTANAREADVKKGMDSAQITGAASSYARKYALGGLFCLDDNKDPDSNEHQEQLDKAQDKEDKEIKKLRDKAFTLAVNLGYKDEVAAFDEIKKNKDSRVDKLDVKGWEYFIGVLEKKNAEKQE